MPTPTLKQKLFVKEYIKNNGNGTQAALKVYNVNGENTAHAIASQNLQKVTVKEELDKILKKGELELKNITNRLTDVMNAEPAKGFSGTDVVEAIKTGLKLHGVLADRKNVTTYNVNADFEKLSKYELIELHKKKTKETQNILEGEEV